MIRVCSMIAPSVQDNPCLGSRPSYFSLNAMPASFQGGEANTIFFFLRIAWAFLFVEICRDPGESA